MQPAATSIAGGVRFAPSSCKAPSCRPQAAAPRAALRRAACPPTHTNATCRRDVSLTAVRADSATDSADTATLQTIATIMNGVDKSHAATLEENAGKQMAANTGGDTEIRAKVVASVNDLAAGLLEREAEVRLMLLAALCGEHLLLLGPPGTAKSELSRRLSKLTGGKYFERLLTRFSVPEELFGPLSMKGLENDEYVRKIDGYLPTAEVAFVDEIFKANSAILNALLTLLNERMFDNGNERFDVPLLCLVGASNELPESEELDALYDRFLIRRQVAQVSSANIAKLARLAAGGSLEGDSSSPEGDSSSTNGAPRPAELTMTDFRAACARARAGAELPESVVDLLTTTRDWLQDKCEPPVYVSDRRFMKAVNLLQTAAFCDGRDQVNEYDCLLLEYVFGNRPDDANKVRAQVLDTIASDPGLQQAELVFLGQFGRACRALAARDTEELAEASAEAASLVELLSLRHAGLAATLDGPDGGFPQLRSSVWQSPAAVQAAVQALSPHMAENRRRVEDLLREAMLLQAALDSEVNAGVLEKLLPKRFKQYQKGVSDRA